MKFWRGTSPKLRTALEQPHRRRSAKPPMVTPARIRMASSARMRYRLPLPACRPLMRGLTQPIRPALGQPFGPASNAADKWDARPAPGVWDPPRVRSRPMPPSPPPTAPMPVSPDPAYRLPDPPVFAASSTASSSVASARRRCAERPRRGRSPARRSRGTCGVRCWRRPPLPEAAGPRQDAYALGRTPDGKFLVIAVADGVSQSPRSDLGARVAVSAATRELVAMLSSGGVTAIDMEHLYNAVAGEMLGTGRNRGLLDKDICSILILAVIPAVPRPDGMRQVWTSWIGDVSLWIHRQGSLYRVTGQEKSGMDRNTLNAVLPFNPDWAEQSTVNLQPSDRVAVVTDGLSDSLSGIPEAAEFFARQWAASAPTRPLSCTTFAMTAPAKATTVRPSWFGAVLTSPRAPPDRPGPSGTPRGQQAPDGRYDECLVPGNVQPRHRVGRARSAWRRSERSERRMPPGMPSGGSR